MATVAEEILYCVIDNDLRVITIPPDLAILGVEGDKEVHRIYFKMPRTYGEFDLSEFNIYINYRNAKSEDDFAIITDRTVEDDSIIFSWLPSSKATAYKGKTYFIACLKKSDTEGILIKDFNTTLASLPVLEGLEVSASDVLENESDLVEQLLSLITSETASEASRAAAEEARVYAENARAAAEEARIKAEAARATAETARAAAENAREAASAEAVTNANEAAALLTAQVNDIALVINEEDGGLDIVIFKEKEE